MFAAPARADYPQRFLVHFEQAAHILDGGNQMLRGLEEVTVLVFQPGHQTVGLPSIVCHQDHCIQVQVQEVCWGKGRAPVEDVLLWGCLSFNEHLVYNTKYGNNPCICSRPLALLCKQRAHALAGAMLGVHSPLGNSKDRLMHDVPGSSPIT